MKAIVMAAGLGTRMRPLSLLRAKPVMPVLNRPLLHWTLELLARNGFTDLVINVHHLPRTVKEAVGTGRKFGVSVTWSFEREILGTSGGPRKMRRFFGDEPFLVVNGDMVFDFDLASLMRKHVATGARATLALRKNPNPKKYGAVITDAKGRIRAIANYPKPARGTASLFTGIHIMDPAILDRLPKGPSDTIRDLYAPLLAEGELLQGVRVRGPWYDLGSPKLYLASHKALLARDYRGVAREGSVVHAKARVHKGATLIRSVVGAGSVVGKGAVIRDSVLWDGVAVGASARVQGSILTTGTEIEGTQDVRGVVVVRTSDLRKTPARSDSREGQQVVEIEP